MARYTDLDRCASDALELCERVRELAPLDTFRHVARQCVRDPERMAQLIMTLAAFVDIQVPISVLRAQVDAIVESRVQSAARTVQLLGEKDTGRPNHCPVCRNHHARTGHHHDETSCRA
ncbi:hypothetical protein [Nocardia terpenica]|uniref:Uncharacterized protein n=1 Tax=Nocardia terpenica TaxID=455432 RepID=A0A164H0C6_9NOCA|nr:hypothetical protein [Nocardia terpenica]KZM68096.1 hypothetical protein AWN90_09140 [Nocardia terpenica]NQE89049.1 hypothetical protein [Nocardia terpenica]